ncbi:MAG: hypothetical protein NZM40_02365 [Sphingomonadaceae bacterium]|nr:hypothetical protein [Thermaurantiacus sp.]MCS6986270.1 hypothetical protein [Sphingomonadaceae bacterium]MDW8415719.1 hypothetical protein [Thermaurantiacus sp.]
MPEPSDMLKALLVGFLLGFAGTIALDGLGGAGPSPAAAAP